MSRVSRSFSGLTTVTTVVAAALALMVSGSPAIAQAAQPDTNADAAGASLIQPAADAYADPITGRHMIFRIHVDAAHVEWNETTQNLEVGVMEGEIKPENYRPADQVAIRLGPDADMDGDEVTRFLVPDDPAYQFLGEPGTIWWNAAMQWNPNAGVFAGIGAGILPDTIQPESVNIALVGVDGPGDVVVFNNNVTGIRPRLDSRGLATGALQAISGLSSGAHGHYNWAFSQPGRYVLKFQASATTTDGRQIQGPVSELLWLVGTDSDVGLPAGTTPSRTITRTVEQMAAGQSGQTPDTPIVQPEQPGGEPGDANGSQPDNPGTDGGSDANDANNSSEITNDVTLPWKYTCAVPDHYDLMAQAKDDQVSVSLLQGPEGNATALQSRSIVMPVPDTVSTVIDGTNLQKLGKQGTRIWALPETQDPKLVWSGLNTGDVDYGLLDQAGVELKLGYVSGPQRGSHMGRMVMWDYPIQTGLRVLMDSADTTKTISFPEQAHRHMATSFDMPGLYEADFGYWVTYNQQTMDRFNLTMAQNYNSFTLFYAVGNEAIEQACPGYLEQYGLIGGSEDEHVGEGSVQPPQAPGDSSSGMIGAGPGSSGLGDTSTGSDPTNTGSSNQNGGSSSSSGADTTTPGTGADPTITGGPEGSNGQKTSSEGHGGAGSHQADGGIAGKQLNPPGTNVAASQGVTATGSGSNPLGGAAFSPNLTAFAGSNGLLAQTGSSGLSATNSEGAQSGAQGDPQSGASAGLNAGEASQSGLPSQTGAQGQSGANNPNQASNAGQDLSKTGLGANSVWIVVALWVAALIALIALIVERYRAKRRP